MPTAAGFFKNLYICFSMYLSLSNARIFSPSVIMSIFFLKHFLKAEHKLMLIDLFSAYCRVKKHFKRKCSWRCVALVFMFLTVGLAAVVAYFVGK